MNRMLNLDPTQLSQIFQSFGVNPRQQMQQPQMQQPMQRPQEPMQGYNQMLKLSGMNSQAMTPRQSNRLNFLENKFRRMG